MARSGKRSGTRRLLALAALGGLALGLVHYQMKRRDDIWRERTSAFVAQVDALGTKLEPGGSGVVHVTANEADELILLPSYSTREELDRRLPGRPQILLDTLYWISSDDHASPSLVWLRGGRILSINTARFSVGLNLTPCAWPLHGPYDVRVTKEKQSANPFLSLTFDDL